MATDVVGPHQDVGRSKLVTAVLPVLDQLRTDAERIDVEGVERHHIDDLASAGFFAAASPKKLGGTAVRAPVIRELIELLAGSSGSVWFVATQHRSPAEAAASTVNRAISDEWAKPLATGEALGAVAFAHLRRPGLPSVRATPDGGGWRVNGRLDWVTSWGLADVLLLMAETEAGEVVQAMIPAKKTKGLVVSGHLGLAAMSATSTVEAEISNLKVTRDQVAHVIDKPEWAKHDSERTVNASPAVFGLLRSTLDALAQVGQRRGAPEAVALAHRWGARTRQIRSRAYALMDGVGAGELMEERVLLRAEALHLAQQATAALVTARGGKAMLLETSAQRFAREALFYLVQAQTLSLRQNLLALYNRPD